MRLGSWALTTAERYGAWLCALAALYASWRFELSGSLGEAAAPSFLGAVISLSAILIGFLVTAKTLLVSVHDRRLMRDLRLSGYQPRIMRAIRLAVWWHFPLLILSVGGFFLCTDAKAATPQWRALLALIMGLMAGALWSSGVAVKVVFDIAEHLSQTER